MMRQRWPGHDPVCAPAEVMAVWAHVWPVWPMRIKCIWWSTSNLNIPFYFYRKISLSENIVFTVSSQRVVFTDILTFTLGCWCLPAGAGFDKQGFGSPVDNIDKSCREFTTCYNCLYNPAPFHGENCNEWAALQQRYNIQGKFTRKKIEEFQKIFPENCEKNYTVPTTKSLRLAIFGKIWTVN